MENKLNHTYLEYKCDSAICKLNLYTGGFIYELPLYSVGEGNFKIDISLVYNSNNYQYYYNAPYYSTLEKWKLNIHQFIYYTGKYIYIDSKGFKYDFYKMDDGKYAESSGSGFILTVSENNFLLSDKLGNKIEFDSNGRIIRLISGINSAIEKKFIYVDNFIAVIEDVRNQDKNINFIYSNTQLIEIKNRSKKDAIKFNYVNLDLFSIEKKIGNIYKKIVVFKYDATNKLLAVNGMNDSALFFEYTNDKVTSIASGDSRLILDSKLDSNNYLGNDLYLNNDEYPSIINVYEKEFDIQSIYNNYGNSFTYSENNSCTKVRKSGILLNYYFNDYEATESIVEEISDNEFKTINKTGGYELSTAGASNFKFNCKNAQILKENSKYIVPSDLLDKFTAIFPDNKNGSDKKHKYIDRYVVSFWINFEQDQYYDVIAKFTYQSNRYFENLFNYDDSFYTMLGSVKANTWQYITIPINFERAESHSMIGINGICAIKENIKDMRLFFENSRGNVHLADLRIDSGSENIVLIDDQNIKDIVSIIYTNYEKIPNHYVNIDESFYLTEKDIFETYKNMQTMYFHSYFYLSVCDGRIQIPVRELFFETKNSSKKYSFSIKRVDYTGGEPNYKTRSVSRINKNQWSLTEVKIHFFETYYENKKSVAVIDKFNGSLTDGYAPASEETSYFNYNGTIYKSIDTYNTAKIYTYDDFGNITEEEIINVAPRNPNPSRIKTEYNYDDSDSRFKETLKSVKKGKFTQYFDTHDTGESTTVYDGAHHKSKTIKNENCFFNDKIKTSSLRDENDVIISNNNYVYDSTGKLVKATGLNNKKYSFSHYPTGINYYEDDKIIMTKTKEWMSNFKLDEKKNLANATKITETRYRVDKETAESIMTVIDRYGRVQLIRDADKNEVKYSYQDEEVQYPHGYVNYDFYDFNESPFAAKVTEIYDPYEELVYSYHYNDDNTLCGYNTLGNFNTNQISVKQISQTETEYNFNNVKRISTVLYDDNNQDRYARKYINPRLHKTKEEEEEDNFGDEYEYEYNFDGIGRKTAMCTAECKYNSGFLENTRYSILRFSNYEEFTTNIIYYRYIFYISVGVIPMEEKEFFFNYSYDDFGNLIQIKESGKVFNKLVIDKEDPKLNLSNQIDYTYDSLNRVKEEKNSVLGNYKYKYNNNDISVIEKDGLVIKSFGYNNGKKAYYTKNNQTYTIKYDYYGNVIKILNNDVKWNKRNYLDEYNSTKYFHNHQGVCFRKENADGTRKEYYLDGSKILAEDWYNSSSDKLLNFRYYYNAEGIAGIRYKNVNYNFLLDALGNVNKVMNKTKMIAEYNYDAWGNTTITYLGTPEDDERFVVENNPFRWKGYYYDTVNELYNINGRYYNPECMLYLDAHSPELLFETLQYFNVSNRNMLTNNNAIMFSPNSDTIFTIAELYADSRYDVNEDKSWWSLHWKKIIKWIVFGSFLLTSFSLMLVSYDFAVGMLISGTKCAITGFASGAVLGGVISKYSGNSFIQGAAQGALDGILYGFALGALMYSVSYGVKAISNLANRAKSVKTACFKEGTLILTEDGYKNIEDIEVGDKVYSYDEGTGVTDYKEVVRLFRNESTMRTTLSIKADDGTIDEIVSTPGHKYYLPENKINRNPNEILEHASYDGLNEKWVSAGLLTKGDKVLLSGGKYGIIISVKTEQCEPFTTYNFEVEDFHTYYVGTNGICVHNAGPCQLDPSDIRYTQNNADSIFTKGPHAGESVDDLIGALKSGAVTPDDIPPLEVFKAKGEIWSINNRRLYAYKMAGVESVPVKWVSRSSMGHRWTGDGVNFYLRR